MKLVTVSGPHGSGKGVVGAKVLGIFSDTMKRIVPVTTRTPRPGEVDGRDYHFILRAEYEYLKHNGLLAYAVHVRDGQWSGTRWSDLERAPAGFLDITTEGARHMRKLVEERGGAAFTIYLYASSAERLTRVMLRDPRLTLEKAQDMLARDPVSGDQHGHDDFSLVILNRDGQLDRTVAAVTAGIQEFFSIVGTV